MSTRVQREPARGQKATTKRRSRLRFECLNAFVDIGILKGDLTPSEVVVWLILFRDTKPDGSARASLDDIARRGCLSRKTVGRALARLKARSMLRVLRTGGLNRGPSTYAVFPYPMES